GSVLVIEGLKFSDQAPRLSWLAHAGNSGQALRTQRLIGGEQSSFNQRHLRLAGQVVRVPDRRLGGKQTVYKRQTVIPREMRWGRSCQWVFGGVAIHQNWILPETRFFRKNRVSATLPSIDLSDRVTPVQ